MPLAQETAPSKNEKEDEAVRRPLAAQDETDSQPAATLCQRGGFFVLSVREPCEPIRRDIYKRSIQICD
jgi:hypothetical protein